MTHPPPCLKTLQELADSYGVRPEAVSGWIKRGMPVYERRASERGGRARVILDAVAADAWVSTNCNVSMMKIGGAMGRQRTADDSRPARTTTAQPASSQTDHPSSQPSIVDAADIDAQLRSLRAVMAISQRQYAELVRDPTNRTQATGLLRNYLSASEELRRLEMDAPKIKKQRGEVISVAEHRVILAETHGKVAAELRALAKRITPAVVGKRDARQIYALIQREVEDCMRHTSNVLAQYEAEHLTKGGE
jgi:hypothetical protein